MWMLAESAHREHASGAPGSWWTEYRVRKMEAADYEEFHRYHRTGPCGYVLEARYCHDDASEQECSQHDGAWRVYEYGITPKAAIAGFIGDDHFRWAVTRHPAHAAARRVWDRQRRLGRARDVLYRATHVEGFPRHTYVERNVEADVRERAEEQFIKVLKAARLFTAATHDTAPNDKVDAIRARVKADYADTLSRELARHGAMLAKYQELSARLREGTNL